MQKSYEKKLQNPDTTGMTYLTVKKVVVARCQKNQSQNQQNPARKSLKQQADHEDHG
jgi:hypothetical protein